MGLREQSSSKTFEILEIVFVSSVAKLKRTLFAIMEESNGIFSPIFTMELLQRWATWLGTQLQILLGHFRNFKHSMIWIV